MQLARKIFYLYRLVLLRKKPTALKFICAVIVFIGLIFSLIPTIAGLDTGAVTAKERYMEQPKLHRILWPLIFMFGFVSHFNYMLTSHISHCDGPL